MLCKYYSILVEYFNRMHSQENEKSSGGVIRFFVLSFKYSQGDEALQNEMFDYAYTTGIYKHVPSVARDSFVNFKTPDKHKKIYNPHVMSGTFSKQWASMKDRLVIPNREVDLVSNIYSITKGMIEKDIHFIKKGREERNHRRSKVPDDSEDPNASFIRRYAMQQHSTGDLVIDMLFSEVRNSIQSPVFSNEIHELRELWETRHRNRSFY